MAKHRKDYNTEPYDQQADEKKKSAEFDDQYEQNRESGSAKAEQDPYRRPQPTNSNKKLWN